MKASHLFNLMDARGIISVAERQAYIGRVRNLARHCCETWVESGQNWKNIQEDELRNTKGNNDE